MLPQAKCEPRPELDKITAIRPLSAGLSLEQPWSIVQYERGAKPLSDGRTMI
jgi:hypothetical protein